MIKEVLIFLIAIILSIISVFLIATTNLEGNSVRYVNCGVSEISPDYPTKIKEACRKARSDLTK